MRTREGLLRGGERGEAIALGEPEYSLLYQSVMGSRRPYMPPRRDDHAGRLTQADLALLRQWIEAGVPWPDAPPRAVPGLPVRAARFTGEQLQFWSLRPPVASAIPLSRAGQHPIDAFLDRERERHCVTPAPPAAPRDLVRRAYFDLIGLPPSPREVAAFERDPSEESWRQLIDRLLASPEYGVRWARHWLDLVRYADSGGFEFDNDRPNAARYRDWVVRAFNTDLPYDRFVREQLAGDETEPASIDARTATGFLRLGPEHNLKNDLTRQLELDDLVSTTSLVFLGLTTGCARCHDHKYDPISQADYYRLQSAFYSTRALDVPLAAPEVVARHQATEREAEARLRPLAEAKRDIEAPYREAAIQRKLALLPRYMREAWQAPAAQRTAGQRLNVRQIEMIELSDEELAGRMTASDRIRYRAVRTAMGEIEAARPRPLPAVMAIGEHGREPLAPFQAGGIEAIELTVPFRLIPAPVNASTTFRRRSLAEWITAPRHPLTARVMVNRIWQHHFGQGLVRTASDFGRRGERPTHPELLDWLALRFVESGWSIKQMHRVMMTSAAYRLAGAGPATASWAADPGNRLVWHHRPARLEGEVLRDAMLAVAGTLDPTPGGAAVHPFIDPALWQKSSLRAWPGRPESDRSTWRRSLYVFQKRSIRYPMFEAFDQPDPVTSCARRNETVTAPQALVLMNGGFARGQAAEFARRLARESSRSRAAMGEPEAQVRLGFELALGRAPSENEERASVHLVRELGLTEFCLALFNLNEFVFAP